MRAKISRLEKSPLQSGKRFCNVWRLTFEAESPRQAEPLMGWTSAADTLPEVKLNFPAREQAIAYAERHGMEYVVVEPVPVASTSKTYGDNFRSERKIPWSH